MSIQDILPITSIVLMSLGFIIVLIGIIYLASYNSKDNYTSSIPNKEIDNYLLNNESVTEEVNHMFSYFMDEIDKKNEKLTQMIESSNMHHTYKPEAKLQNMNMNEEMYILNNKYYDQVIKYKEQGKTSEQIAKELNMGKGEVDLILGVNQMR